MQSGAAMITLVDPDDERIRDYRDLKDVNLRKILEPAGGLFIAESALVIRQALVAGYRPRSLLLASDRVDEFGDLLALLPPDTPVYLADYDVLESVAGFPVHRGALASMHRPEPREWSRLLDGANRVVILEDIVDHTNLGAIFRSIAALGWDAVLISPRCADPLYRRSVRVSMGAVFHLPWARIEPWPSALVELATRGWRRVALTPSENAQPLDHVERHGSLALMLGSEGPGLTQRSLDHADELVTIPMAQSIDSLNVSAAAAIALWALRPA
jgi:tRNA G18 (ribose-2'-O)-methylase SpoU